MFRGKVPIGNSFANEKHFMALPQLHYLVNMKLVFIDIYNIYYI